MPSRVGDAEEQQPGEPADHEHRQEDPDGVPAQLAAVVTDRRVDQREVDREDPERQEAGQADRDPGQNLSRPQTHGPHG